MDTRSRKWTNKVLITLVMIAMTLSGIYGLNTIHNMVLTGDNSFSLDEQDQSDYIKHTQMSLFDKWADQEGDKVYYTQANHVSESLLNKIKKESFVKVTMKVKPYDKKMVTTSTSLSTPFKSTTKGSAFALCFIQVETIGIPDFFSFACNSVLALTEASIHVSAFFCLGPADTITEEDRKSDTNK